MLFILIKLNQQDILFRLFNMLHGDYHFKYHWKVYVYYENYMLIFKEKWTKLLVK
jgi:hypothetical protein